MGAADILFEENGHRVIRFSNLVTGAGVQANQFAISHDGHGALIDPGGDLTFTPLTIALSRHLDLRGLDYILASHQDPDIIASLPRWLMYSECRVAVSRLWARFLPHLASSFVTNRATRPWEERMVALPDAGAVLPFGDGELWALPAHFLHSVGNFSFYDPISRILFSGDIGASMDGEEGPVSSFETHLPTMLGFHRRYMAGNRACRLWVRMVRDLEPAMVVPQHGGYFDRPATIGRFLDWLERLECGPDLLTGNDYRLPGRAVDG